MPNDLPIHEIARTKDWCAWAVVHVGGGEIVIPIRPVEDIVVRKVRIHDRIAEVLAGDKVDVCYKARKGQDQVM
jgi:hypothetical protein